MADEPSGEGSFVAVKDSHKVPCADGGGSEKRDKWPFSPPGGRDRPLAGGAWKAVRPPSRWTGYRATSAVLEIAREKGQAFKTETPRLARRFCSHRAMLRKCLATDRNTAPISKPGHEAR